MISPWDRFAPATLEFCEHLMNGWVRQPANTWSNIGFILVGIYLWKRTPATKPWLHIFSVGSISVGITSMIYHTSMTFVAQFFDVSSMFITAGMLVVLNAMRLHWIRADQLYKSLVLMQLVAMLAMFVFQGSLGEKIFATQVAFIAISEVYIARKQRLPLKRFRWWMVSFALFAAATFVWSMDIKKVWCDPDNHWFNGHAAWHLLNAAVVWTLYLFYEEIIPPNSVRLAD